MKKIRKIQEVKILSSGFGAGNTELGTKDESSGTLCGFDWFIKG
jgi:hypothetical protein